MISMCMHWSTNGKTCAFCGEPIPDVIEAKTIEIAAGKIQGEVISSEPSPVNEILLEAAIEFLHDIDSEEIDTIQINSTKYDDRSRGVTIEITYPPEFTELEKQAKEVWERLKDNTVN